MDERESLRRRLARWRTAPRERPARIPRPGPGQESVWDHPRPPRVERVAQRVRVECRGRLPADTTAALRVLETAGAPTYHIPPADVELSPLEPAPGRAGASGRDGRATGRPAWGSSSHRPSPGASAAAG